MANEILINEALTDADPFIANLDPGVVRYLGPGGSYSEIMAGILFGSYDHPLRGGGWRPPTYYPHSDLHVVTEEIGYVQKQAGNFGVLPVENTQTSNVHEVADALLTGDLVMRGEGKLLVELVLAGLVDDRRVIKRVLSHYKALVQGQALLKEMRIPAPNQVKVDSTSKAAELVREEGDETVAALCSDEAARNNGLVVIQDKAHGIPHNNTRFLIVQANNGTYDPHNDLDHLRKGGHFSEWQTAKVVGLVSPHKPASAHGFNEAMSHMNAMDVHDVVVTRRNAPQAGSTDDYRQYLVDFTSAPHTLLEVFGNPRSYKKFMDFVLLGVFPAGSLYRVESRNNGYVISHGKPSKKRRAPRA